MHKYHIGSFAMTVRWEPPFLYRSEPYEAAELLNRLQEQSKLPLLVAADFERGVTMRLHGATTFPHAMAFGAAGKADYAEAFGRITAAGISRRRRALEFFSRCRRQLQSRRIPSSTRAHSAKIRSRWETLSPPTFAALAPAE